MRTIVLITVLLKLCQSQDSTYDVQPGCMSRWSGLSGTTDDAEAIVQCAEGEVMTGCSSYLPGDAAGSRDGEFIRKINGKPLCVARNGYQGSGVKAIARCCNWQGLTCSYEHGSKSGSAAGNTSTVSCLKKKADAYLTGCIARTGWQNLIGGRPNSEISGDLTPIINQECIVTNAAGSAGVWAYAACCASPNFECKAKWSAKSGGDVGDITAASCDCGWTLTSCNAYSSEAGTNGAFIGERDCIAVSGGEHIYAVAICCRKME